MRKLITGDDIVQLMKELDVRVHMTGLNGEANGFSTKLNDGYLIVLEKNLCFDKLLSTIQHELSHIAMGHLDDDIKSEAQKELEVVTRLNGG